MYFQFIASILFYFYSTLTITSAATSDGGQYDLVIENSAGSKTLSVKVIILDVPGEIRNLKVKEVCLDYT